MKSFVYSLVCPIENEPKYIGSTSRIHRPRYEHCCPSNIKRSSGRKRAWLELLYSKKLKPIVEIIHECESSQVRKIEGQYTKTMKDLGFDLLNVFDGCSHNETTKRWVVEGNKKRVRSEGSRLKIAQANTKFIFILDNGDEVLGLTNLSKITGIASSSIHYKIKHNIEISGVRSVRDKI